MDIMLTLGELDDWLREARDYTDEQWQEVLDGIARGPLPRRVERNRHAPHFALMVMLRQVAGELAHERGVIERLRTYSPSTTFRRSERASAPPAPPAPPAAPE